MNVLNVDIRCHELLNEIYSERKVGVEIGVYDGRLSWRLLAAHTSLFLYMVDPWVQVDANSTYASTGDKIAQYTQEEHDIVMGRAIDSVRPFNDRCKVLRMTSVEASRMFDDFSLDFVFIDGDHSYEATKTDIAYWYPKVRNSGVLGGHDYRTDKNYGVKRAVDDFVNDTGLPLRLKENFTWFVTK